MVVSKRVASEGRPPEGLPLPLPLLEPGGVGRGVAVSVELNCVSQDWPEVTSSNQDENSPSNRLLDNCREVSSVVVSAVASVGVENSGEEGSGPGTTGAEEGSGTATTGEDAGGATGATEDATEGMTMTVVSIEAYDETISGSGATGVETSGDATGGDEGTKGCTGDSDADAPACCVKSSVSVSDMLLGSVSSLDVFDPKNH